jgi:hypothetical protein
MREQEQDNGRTRLGNTPTCPFCDEQHSQDEDCAEGTTANDSTMHVVVYSPSTDEVYLQRALADDEVMDARTFADQIADMFCMDIDDSDGYIPNCSGDIRVEFRPDPSNPTHMERGKFLLQVRGGKLMEQAIIITLADALFSALNLGQLLDR